MAPSSTATLLMAANVSVTRHAKMRREKLPCCLHGHSVLFAASYRRGDRPSDLTVRRTCNVLDNLTLSGVNERPRIIRMPTFRPQQRYDPMANHRPHHSRLGCDIAVRCRLRGVGVVAFSVEGLPPYHAGFELATACQVPLISSTTLTPTSMPRNEEAGPMNVPHSGSALRGSHATATRIKLRLPTMLLVGSKSIQPAPGK
jgi:hypothetical protein